MLNIVHVLEVSKYIETLTKYQDLGQNLLFLGTADVPAIYYTHKNDINREVVLKDGYTLVEYPSNGGSFVVQPGDMVACFTLFQERPGWAMWVLTQLQQWLSQYHITVVIYTNDLLIHGRKVMGYTETTANGMTISAIVIAMHNSQELVDKICLKPKAKHTCGLYEFGITNQEVLDKIIEYTKTFIDNMVGGK